MLIDRWLHRRWLGDRWTCGQTDKLVYDHIHDDNPHIHLCLFNGNLGGRMVISSEKKYSWSLWYLYCIEADPNSLHDDKTILLGLKIFSRAWNFIITAAQITSLTIVNWTVYSYADQRKHQSSASLAFVRGIHRWPVNSPHKWPVTRKMFPFDDVTMMKLQALLACIA